MGLYVIGGDGGEVDKVGRVEEIFGDLVHSGRNGRREQQVLSDVLNTIQHHRHVDVRGSITQEVDSPFYDLEGYCGSCRWQGRNLRGVSE